MSKLPVTYSELDACSPPVTPPEVVEWSEQVAGSIKSYLSHDNTSVDPQDIFLDSPSCCIWAYRHCGTEYICADFCSKGTDSSRAYTMNFRVTAGLGRDFSLDEPSVPDAAEALHCISLIVNKLGSSITMDMWQRSPERLHV
ncbi:hypothetical protein [Xanthomonas arboricola]|uniref:hypothetical protein n=1 Tax=Xanthomonas arboricola TaxID=56448 RepID=UPI0011B009CC|nr:hypothetical protein [Xanthomonas arboricola]